MKAKSRKTIGILLLMVCGLISYSLWLSFRPVDIVAVHDNGNHSYILVNSFPVTEQGRIHWWQENQDMLKSRYNVPHPDNDGFYTVVFWDFGDGYKEEGKYDRLCFDDMKSAKNCIEKNKIFTITHGKNMDLSFTTNNKIYRLRENGKIVKDESN